MWLPTVPTSVQMATALFPTKTNLWFLCPSPPFGLGRGKALKNLSNYSLLGWCVTMLGKLAVTP
jgi:hypothetical protein